MEDQNNGPDGKSGFMQGWGFIVLILVGVTSALAALKYFMN